MLRNAARGVFVTSYFILLIIFLAASATPSLNPSRWWWVGFTGLIYPYILLVVTILTLIMIFYRPRVAILGIIALLFSYEDIGALVAFRLPAKFNIQKDPDHFRLTEYFVVPGILV